jgi:hypothetical protein
MEKVHTFHYVMNITAWKNVPLEVRYLGCCLVHSSTLTTGEAGWNLNCTTGRRHNLSTGQNFHCHEGNNNNNNNLTSYIHYGIYFKKVRNTSSIVLIFWLKQKRLSSKNSLLSSIVYLLDFLNIYGDLGVTLNLQCTILEPAKVKLRAIIEKTAI